MNNPVAEFVAEARRCCALIENEQRGAASAFEKECLVALLRLYEQILRLPVSSRCSPLGMIRQCFSSCCPQVLGNSGAFLSYPNPVQERIN
jgi:hypothetical protein